MHAGIAGHSRDSSQLYELPEVPFDIRNFHMTLTVLVTVHMPPLDGRLIQLWLYGRSHPDDNHYSHPIDVVVLVDLNLKKVGSYLRFFY